MNKAWCAAITIAVDLIAWLRLYALAGTLAKAEPKTLRWQLWHTPARVVRHARRNVVRILDDWPNADALLAAYRRIALIG